MTKAFNSNHNYYTCIINQTTRATPTAQAGIFQAMDTSHFSNSRGGRGGSGGSALACGPFKGQNEILRGKGVHFPLLPTAACANVRHNCRLTPYMRSSSRPPRQTATAFFGRRWSWDQSRALPGHAVVWTHTPIDLQNASPLSRDTDRSSTGKL